MLLYILQTGKRLCVGYDDGTVKLWDMKSGGMIHNITGNSWWLSAGLSLSPLSCEWGRVLCNCENKLQIYWFKSWNEISKIVKLAKKPQYFELWIRHYQSQKRPSKSPGVVLSLRFFIPDTLLIHWPLWSSCIPSTILKTNFSYLLLAYLNLTFLIYYIKLMLNSTNGCQCWKNIALCFFMAKWMVWSVSVL